MSEFSPTQRKILAVLSDGMPHKMVELTACMDELTNPRTLHYHLSLIREKLRPRGEDVICQFIYRQRQYRHVRLLHAAGDGCR